MAKADSMWSKQGMRQQGERLLRLAVPVLFICLLGVIVVPMPPFVMDVLLCTNITLAAVTLMTTIYVQHPLEFSVFPSLLLGTTLFRLVLNIATTRLILAADASTPGEAEAVAGLVIQSFAHFVAGSSVVVGVILFIILVIVQFVVITKGATRISEVAARFTLDGMPGKQMAIDADLNAGLIDEGQARKRREDIAQEADFYGAMDGAAKFVRGDAIAGIIITMVNICGGFAVGMLIKGWSFTDSLSVFTMLTIGDGLVSQVPAFIIAIAAGLIVTRSSSRQDLGTELASQLTRRYAALGITSAFLAAMAFTGMPMVPMLTMATLTGVGTWLLHRKHKKQQTQQHATEAKAKSAAAEPSVTEQAIAVDALELELGYGLVRLVDKSQGGDLLDRVSMIRKQLAADLGLVMPPVRIRDNVKLEATEYAIKLRGCELTRGEVYPDQYLAMDGGLATEPIGGLKTVEPAFGLDAYWIDEGQRQRAESLNYTLVDATSVLATHLSEVVKTHAYELLNREETHHLIAQLKQKSPKLCEEVLGGETPIVKAGDLQRVLQNLLRERVPVRDMETIVETLGDWGQRTKDMDVLTEYVRDALRRTICSQYVEQEMEGNELNGEQKQRRAKLYCISLDPGLEDQISSYVERTPEGTTMTMPPGVASKVGSSVIQALQSLVQLGRHPVVLASPGVRGVVRRLLESRMPTAAVLGYNEVARGVEVESVGMAEAIAEAQPVASPA